MDWTDCCWVGGWALFTIGDRFHWNLARFVGLGMACLGALGWRVFLFKLANAADDGRAEQA